MYRYLYSFHKNFNKSIRDFIRKNIRKILSMDLSWFDDDYSVKPKFFIFSAFHKTEPFLFSSLD